MPAGMEGVEDDLSDPEDSAGLADISEDDDRAPEPVAAPSGGQQSARGGRQSAPRQRRVGQSAPRRGQAVPAASRSYRPADADDDYEPPVEGFTGDPEEYEPGPQDWDEEDFAELADDPRNF